MNYALSQAPVHRRPRWRETAALLGAAWLVPVLVHLVPWAGPRPLGVYLLPAFWTVYVALYCYGLRLAVVVALVTPVANVLMTGLPEVSRLGLSVAELLVFCLVGQWLLQRRPKLWVSAPLCYLAAKAVSVTIEWAVPAFKDPRSPLDHLLDSALNGIAGMAVLVDINALLCRLVPRGERRSQ